jgi:hypothetical protein
VIKTVLKLQLPLKFNTSPHIPLVYCTTKVAFDLTKFKGAIETLPRAISVSP